MLLYLTPKYFVGELLVPNITGATPVAQANAISLQWFIIKYEPEFMKGLLGEELYEQFVDGLDVGEGVTPLAKWTDLRDRIFQTVTIDGQPYYFSPAAGYVYYHIMRDMISATTAAGEVKQKTTGSAGSVTNTMKMVRAWNEMNTKCEEIWAWLEDENETYDTFDPTQENPFRTMNMFNI